MLATYRDSQIRMAALEAKKKTGIPGYGDQRKTSSYIPILRNCTQNLYESRGWNGEHLL
jgi:hypothetical protein